jgi:hypothetical protein
VKQNNEREAFGTGARQPEFASHGHGFAVFVAGQEFLVRQSQGFEWDDLHSRNLRIGGPLRRNKQHKDREEAKKMEIWPVVLEDVHASVLF